MKTTETDILISGGGIAGLTAACAFGRAGFSVLCVDPARPVLEENADGADIRTTAFLQPSRQLLESAGLWERFAPHAAPLQIMRIVDAGGETSEAREITDFDAAGISDSPFGWNLPNWLLRRECLGAIRDMPNVRFRHATATANVTTRETEARVGLSDGSLVRARLLIAADGRNSNIRAQAGIGVKTWRYGQKALVFAVTHANPHHNISTEIHRSGGPFTLVPLPDFDGLHRSAVVWMDHGHRTAPRLTQPVEEFERAVLERSAGLFGPLKLQGRRAVWPIISQLADRMEAQRTAILAEAAHVVPPIGAQGLNMSLADIATLLDLARNDALALGSPQMLTRFHRRRWPEVKLRVSGIDLLNRSSMVGNPLLRDMRRLGLKMLHQTQPVRKAVMRAGLGAT